MTWNPVTGCSAISPGCKNCYAERMSYRLQAMGQPKYTNGFKPTLHPQTLDDPLHWKKPSKIFVNSMSDLFHPAVPLDFIEKVFSTIQRADWHQFQVLTKRSDRMRELAPRLTWPANLWMGVSIESPAYVYRINDLRTVPARVRFLSLEPLLAPLPNLDLSGIHQVIVGGESGPGARPMELSWVKDLLIQSRKAKVAFFLKQLGGVRKKKAGRMLEGKTYDELPILADESARQSLAQM